MYYWIAVTSTFAVATCSSMYWIAACRGARTTEYGKPTNTGQYINKNFNHLDHVKRINSYFTYLHTRHLLDKISLDNEIKYIFNEFQSDGYRSYILKCLGFKKARFEREGSEGQSNHNVCPRYL